MHSNSVWILRLKNLLEPLLSPEYPYGHPPFGNSVFVRKLVKTKKVCIFQQPTFVGSQAFQGFTNKSDDFNAVHSLSPVFGRRQRNGKRDKGFVAFSLHPDIFRKRITIPRKCRIASKISRIAYQCFDYAAKCFLDSVFRVSNFPSEIPPQ